MREPTRLEIAKETAKCWSDLAHKQAKTIDKQNTYIQRLQERIEEHGARICSECGEPMKQGYCIDGGSEYYCSDDCLHKHYTPEEREEMYDDGNSESYRTEREDESEEAQKKADEERKRNEARANAQLDYLEARYGKDSNLRPDILD